MKDKGRSYHCLYREDEINRKRRGTKLALRIKRMVTDKLRDKRDGRYYEPGIGGPQTGSDETADESGHDEDRKIPAMSGGQPCRKNTKDGQIQINEGGK